MYSPNASKGFISLVGKAIVQMPQEVLQISLSSEKSSDWFKDPFEDLCGAFTGSITTTNQAARQALDLCMTGKPLLEGIDDFFRDGALKEFWAHSRSIIVKAESLFQRQLKGLRF